MKQNSDMILKIGMLILMLFCSACSTSFPVRASFNRSVWFASGTPTTKKDMCSQDRFNIFLKTDLPYPGVEKKHSGKVTGCKGECTPTQLLTFTDIPLKQGLYDLSQSDSCSFESVGAQGKYIVLGTPEISTRAYQRATGWVEVTHYDQNTGLIQGKFNINLIDTTGRGQPVHFRKGRIKVILKKQAG